jgi:RimJ/RimL family protein N-acetyltransferase
MKINNTEETIQFIETTDPGTVRLFREKYLDSLPLAQEYYLEIQIKTSAFYLVNVGDMAAGYFILSPENVLLEYFLLPEWENRLDGIFGQILREFLVKKALCKSFDAALLSCCYGYHKSTRAIGILFREYREKTIHAIGAKITIRRAVMADEARIIAVNEEVFDHPEEVSEYIQARQILLFEIGNRLVGFGIYSPVFPGRQDYDIGMLITPEYRKQGYGAFIIQYLINFCRQNGWNFSAGCDINNIGSRRCLEKAGFDARYRLLEFSF